LTTPQPTPKCTETDCYLSSCTMALCVTCGTTLALVLTLFDLESCTPTSEKMKLLTYSAGSLKAAASVPPYIRRARTPFGDCELFRMAAQGHVHTLTPAHTRKVQVLPLLTHLHDAPPSLTLPSSALPALCADMTSALGPHTPHSNKSLVLGSGPQAPSQTRQSIDSLCLHNVYTTHLHFNLTFSSTYPQPLPGPYRPLPPPLPAPPPTIHSTRCVKAPSTRKKCFSVTYVTLGGIWTASSLPSQPSYLGYGNVPRVPLLSPHARVHCDSSTSPLPSLTLTLIKHRLGGKKMNPPNITFQHKTLLSQNQKKTSLPLELYSFRGKRCLPKSPLPCVTPRHLHRAPRPLDQVNVPARIRG